MLKKKTTIILVQKNIVSKIDLDLDLPTVKLIQQFSSVIHRGPQFVLLLLNL